MKVSDPRVLTEARLKALRHRERHELYRKQHGLTNQAIEAEKSKLWFDLITTLDGKNLSTLKPESQTQIRNLCARGIPVNVRGMVWPILIGWNDRTKNSIAREYESNLREKADRLRRYIKRKSINDRDGYEDVHYALANGGDDWSAEFRKERTAADAEGTTAKTDVTSDIEQSASIAFPNLNDISNTNMESIERKVGVNEEETESVHEEQDKGSSSAASSPDSTNEEKGEIMIDEAALDLDFTRFLEEQVALRGSKFTMSDNEMSDDEETVSTNTTGGLSGSNGGNSGNGGSATDLPTDHVIDLANAFSYDQPTPPRAELNRVASGDATDRSIDYEQVMRECGADLIKRDLPRTFPTLKFFHDGGTLNEDLERVLYAYTIFSPAIGYVQGMSFVVAMLLLYLDETEAFSCLVQLMSKRGVNDFFSLERDSINTYVNIFNFFFQKNLPLLYKHLQDEGLSSEMFLMDWLLTMFVKPLHLDLAARVWDCYLAGDEFIAMRLALGILRLYAPTLCTMEMVDARTYLTYLPQDLDFNRLWESVSHINVSPKTYEKVRDKFESKEQKEAKKKQALDQARRESAASKGGKGKNSDTIGSSSRADRLRVSAKTGVSLKQDASNCVLS